MSQLGIFVLDTSLGVPAEGVEVTLSSVDVDAGETIIARGFTGSDGRIDAFLAADYVLPRGHYRVMYETRAYFAGSGRTTTFPLIQVDFSIADELPYVLPLILTPDCYTFYRGS